jgi:hypothetical protein
MDDHPEFKGPALRRSPKLPAVLAPKPKIESTRTALPIHSQIWRSPILTSLQMSNQKRGDAVISSAETPLQGTTAVAAPAPFGRASGLALGRLKK